MSTSERPASTEPGCADVTAKHPGQQILASTNSVYHEDHLKILGEKFVGTVETASASSPSKPGDHVVGWVYGGGKAHDGAQRGLDLCWVIELGGEPFYPQYTLCGAASPSHAPSLPWGRPQRHPHGHVDNMGLSLFKTTELEPRFVELVHGGRQQRRPLGHPPLWKNPLHNGTVIAPRPGSRKRWPSQKKPGADHRIRPSTPNSSTSDQRPSAVHPRAPSAPNTSPLPDLPNLARAY